MALINPPAPLRLRNAKWRANVPAQVNRSGWTGKRKVVGQAGAFWWSMSGEFVPIIGQTNVVAWRGWFLDLEGPVHRFPVRAVEVQQTAASNPTVASGSTDGFSVPLQGLPLSATVLPKGSLMTITLPSGHGRLVSLSAALVSNGSGLGTATFKQELTETPEIGDAVEIRWPFSTMSLASDFPPGWGVDPGQIYSFSIEAEEAL
ncbi:hypothetical protein M9978_02315 [Sphingomonas sp. MG17]|uniref:Uncharacterized protein n=1 Tax=Sphingomonas tagetis TaxID=2949092 RepID=A0A9X2KJZ5_9SPHN|nr:hypothetical protein [Sphingomonas tagetis]MCP3729250.1 hypothetical protein [Sphingomonas tagetis]